MTEFTAVQGRAGVALSRPSDWPRAAAAWFAVGVLMVAYTSSFVDRQILSLMVEPIRRDLHISDTQFSLLAGLAFSLFYTVMGLPLARLADRASRRLIIMAGVAVWSVMTMGCGFANSFHTLFAARLGVGVGEATLSPGASSMIADYFAPERRGAALAVYAMGPYLGAGLAMIIGGQAVQWMAAVGPLALPGLGGLAPWQMTFVLVGAPGALISALFLLVREPARRGLARPEAAPGLSRFLWRRRRTFVPLVLGFSIFGMAGISYLSWIPAMLIRTHHWSPGRVGLEYGLVLLGFSVPGVVVGGWLSDRLTAQGRTDAPLRVAAVAMAVLAPFAAITPMIAAEGPMLACLAAASFGFGVMNALPATALQLVTPNQLRAQVTAAYFLVGNLISLGLGPTLVAWLSDHLLGGPAKIGVSLGLVSGVCVAIAAGLMACSFYSFRGSVASAQDWQQEPS